MIRPTQGSRGKRKQWAKMTEKNRQQLRAYTYFMFAFLLFLIHLHFVSGLLVCCFSVPGGAESCYVIGLGAFFHIPPSVLSCFPGGEPCFCPCAFTLPFPHHFPSIRSSVFLILFFADFFVGWLWALVTVFLTGVRSFSCSQCMR